MQKTAPTLGRVAVMVGFAFSCFGLLLFLWLSFGGSIPLKPKGFRFAIEFPNAVQLAQEADVRISGVPVGRVKAISSAPDGNTRVIIELKSRYSPLPRDSRAILRSKTLLGETYVEITPGNPSSGRVPENGQLASSQVARSVQLDEIFRAFNPTTRDAFQLWQQSLASSVIGRGLDLNSAIGNLQPFADNANTLVSILASQQGAVQQLVSNTGIVFDALAARDGQLRTLINGANVTFQTTAARNVALQNAIRVLPTFEQESTLTLDQVAAFALNTNPLVNQLRPAARQLSPTLADIRLLSPDLETLFKRLNPLISASRRGLPALSRSLDDLRPLLAQLDPALRQVNPILDYVRLFPRELQSFFSNTVAATQATDLPANSGGKRVHYLRTTNPVNLESLATYPARPGSNRPNPYFLPNGFDRLGSGLQVFDDRHCGNGVPALAPTVVPGGIPGPVQTLLQAAGLAPNQGAAPSVVPAPPCSKQGPFSFQGLTSQYPHVGAAPPK
jgi:phospholipid/cholesterol/gamma-HCH transport system substrate-binding protein